MILTQRSFWYRGAIFKLLAHINTLLVLRETERERASGVGAESEGDAESEAGSRL